jgi:thiol-disulfide isomerase/thioredoxin
MALFSDNFDPFIISMCEPSNLVPFNATNSDLVNLRAGASGVVVVLCYAEWCGPCQSLCHQLPAIAAQYPR